MWDPGEHERFHAAVDPMAHTLQSFVELSVQRPQLADATSIAMSEVAAEHRFAKDGWRMPALNAHAYGIALVNHATDLVDGIAAVAIASRTGPSFAHISIMRSLVEIVPIAHWLLDTDITLEQRVKRSMLHRLVSANQSKRLFMVPGAVEAAEQARERVASFVSANGWPTASGRPLSLDGETHPKPGESFSHLVFGVSDSDHDQSVWNYYSATSHGVFYAQAQRLKSRPGEDVSALDPAAAGKYVVASSGDILQTMTVAFLSLVTLTTVRDSLMGWSRSAEESQRIAELRNWSKGVSEALTNLGRTENQEATTD